MEEAFQEFLKTTFFKRMYPDLKTRQQMSYPFEPPAEFKKFEERGLAEWKSYSESGRNYYLHPIQKREARKRVMRKMESGKELTDKAEKAALEDLDEAGFFFFTCSMSREF